MKGIVASAVTEGNQVKLTIALENGQQTEHTVDAEQGRLWGVGTKVVYELSRERKPRGPRKPKAPAQTAQAPTAPAPASVQ